MEAVHILSDESKALHLFLYFDEEMVRSVRSAFRDGRSAPMVKTPNQSRILVEGLRGS
jgi:hypothetical protein